MRFGPHEHGGIRERWINLVTGEEAVICHDGTILVHVAWQAYSGRKMKRDPAWKLLTSEPEKLKGRKPGRKPKG